MHHVDANKTYGEKTWRQLHKNAASNTEQVLETAPHKAAPTTHHELISDILLWTPSHGRAKAGQPARTYIQQFCSDTGYEDLPEAMDDGEG